MPDHELQSKILKKDTEPDISDAMGYLTRIKDEYISDPYTYDHFLELMRDYKTGKTDALTIIRGVNSLFKNKKYLVEGFTNFLPKNFTIDERLLHDRIPVERLQNVERMAHERGIDLNKEFIRSYNNIERNMKGMTEKETVRDSRMGERDTGRVMRMSEREALYRDTRGIEMNIDKIRNNGIEKQISRERMNERGIERFNDRGIERLNDRGIERLNDRGIERLNDRGIERLNDRGIERLNDRGIERLNDRGIERLNERGIDKGIMHGRRDYMRNMHENPTRSIDRGVSLDRGPYQKMMHERLLQSAKNGELMNERNIDKIFDKCIEPYIERQRDGTIIRKMPLERQHENERKINEERTMSYADKGLLCPERIRQDRNILERYSNDRFRSTPINDNNKQKKALHFVNKVKARLLNRPDSYRTFIEILQLYQKAPTNPSRIFTQLKSILKGNEDLLDEFADFVPQKQFLLQECMQNVNIDELLQTNNNKHLRINKEESATKQEQTTSELFIIIQNILKKKGILDNFLKLLNMYNQEIITPKDFIFLLKPILKDEKLLNALKSYIKYKETDHPPHILKNLNTYKKIHSYRILPEIYREVTCTGQNNIAKTLLNTFCISCPTFASEEGQFVWSRKNVAEEIVYKIEDERYTCEMEIYRIEAFIKELERIENKFMNKNYIKKNYEVTKKFNTSNESSIDEECDVKKRKIEDNKLENDDNCKSSESMNEVIDEKSENNDEKEEDCKYISNDSEIEDSYHTLTFNIEDFSIPGGIIQEILIFIYGDKGFDVLEGILTKPQLSISIVKNRLYTVLKKLRSDMRIKSRIWRETINKNIYKARDQQYFMKSKKEKLCITDYYKKEDGKMSKIGDIIYECDFNDKKILDDILEMFKAFVNETSDCVKTLKTFIEFLSKENALFYGSGQVVLIFCVIGNLYEKIEDIKKEFKSNECDQNNVLNKINDENMNDATQISEKDPDGFENAVPVKLSEKLGLMNEDEKFRERNMKYENLHDLILQNLKGDIDNATFEDRVRLICMKKGYKIFGIEKIMQKIEKICLEYLSDDRNIKLVEISSRNGSVAMARSVFQNDILYRAVNSDKHVTINEIDDEYKTNQAGKEDKDDGDKTNFEHVNNIQNNDSVNNESITNCNNKNENITNNDDKDVNIEDILDKNYLIDFVKLNVNKNYNCQKVYLKRNMRNNYDNVEVDYNLECVIGDDYKIKYITNTEDFVMLKKKKNNIDRNDNQ